MTTLQSEGHDEVIRCLCLGPSTSKLKRTVVVVVVDYLLF